MTRDFRRGQLSADQLHMTLNGVIQQWSAGQGWGSRMARPYTWSPKGDSRKALLSPCSLRASPLGLPSRAVEVQGSKGKKWKFFVEARPRSARCGIVQIPSCSGRAQGWGRGCDSEMLGRGSLIKEWREEGGQGGSEGRRGERGLPGEGKQQVRLGRGDSSHKLTTWVSPLPCVLAC